MNKLTLSSLHAKTRRSLGVSTIAIALGLAHDGRANGPGDNVKLFNKKIVSVPSANPVAVGDDTVSPGFELGLVVEGLDLLENPSGPITNFGYLGDNTRTEPDEDTYLTLDRNPGGPTPLPDRSPVNLGRLADNARTAKSSGTLQVPALERLLFSMRRRTFGRDRAREASIDTTPKISR